MSRQRTGVNPSFQRPPIPPNWPGSREPRGLLPPLGGTALRRWLTKSGEPFRVSVEALRGALGGRGA